MDKNLNYLRVWRNLAELYIEEDINVNKGMELINHVYENSPEDYDILYIKGMGLFKQGDINNSLELLHKSWDLRPVYDHEHYLLIQEVEQALASQNQ